MSERKGYDPETLSDDRKANAGTTHQKLQNEDRTQHSVDPHSGIYHTNVQEKNVNFINTASGYIISDPSKNSGIVFGYDRPSTEASGLGAGGLQGTNTIDIVAGRMSTVRNLKDGQWVNNSFSSDAARIYISQLTDIDLNFGLERGQAGELGPRSGIGIKADAVRVIGKEGVKIVSGRSFAFRGMGPDGETNSQGGTISQPAPPIELIAGNTKYQSSLLPGGADINVLQGVGKGENIRDALRELSTAIEGLYSIVEKMASYNVLAFGGITNGPIAGAISCGVANLLYSILVTPPLHISRGDLNVWKVNYTQPYGDKYVMSRNVYST